MHSTRQRRQLHRLAEAQWWLCYWCTVPMTEETATREHVVPRSKGGGGVATGNVVAACWSCNHQKGAGAAPSESYRRIRLRQHLRAEGLHAEFPTRRWHKEALPNFGKSPDGDRLTAPQYGII